MSESSSKVSKQEFRYWIGKPRDYRSNMSEGRVIDFVTEKRHSTFEFHPIAYRFFNAVLFNDIKKKVRRDWAEIFFVDENNCLSAILFHGYSVENLQELVSQLYYRGHKLEEVSIRVSFNEHKSTDPQAEGNKYHIAEFALSDKEADEKWAEHIEWAQKNLPYRQDTVSAEEENTVTFNYPLPEPIKEEQEEKGVADAKS